jgi:hypothetical protein
LPAASEYLEALNHRGEDMKRLVIAACLLALCSGCMEQQVRNRAMNIANTTTDLLYIEVLDNVARTLDDPSEMPYFNAPAAATAQVQQSLSVTGTPTWGWVGSAAPAFLFYSLPAAFAPSQTDNESWQMSPLCDPDRLYLMHLAYLKAIGCLTAEGEQTLNEYYSARDHWVEIGLKQTNFSNAVWSDSDKLIARQKAVLAGLPDYHEFAWGPDWQNERAKLFNYAVKVGRAPKDGQANDYVQAITSQEYLNLELGATLDDDPNYQRLLAEYNMMLPQPAQPPPTGALTPSTRAASTSSSTGSSSSSGAAGGSAAAASGGKPPLPIHIHYEAFIQQGWFGRGRKCDVPKDACFVGHHCNTYVWVDMSHLDGLNRFTLAILDFYNIGNSGGNNLPQPPVSTLK